MMQELRQWLASSQLAGDNEPRLYVKMRLNYSHPPVCHRSKRREIQRLYNWLSAIRAGQVPSTSSSPTKKRVKIDGEQRLINLTRRYQKLKEFSKLNFDRELTGYLYGCPPKQNLDQLQIQLRCYTGEKHLLLRVCDTGDRVVRDAVGRMVRGTDGQTIRDTGERHETPEVIDKKAKKETKPMNKQENAKDPIDKQNKKANQPMDKQMKKAKGNQPMDKQMKTKENELVVSLDVLAKVFKRVQGESLLSERDGSLVLELTGYRFRSVLVLVFALYTNQLYLRLDSFPELIRVALDLGVEQVLRFVNRLIVTEDPIYLLFKLRKYLADLARLPDVASLTNLSRQMTYVLRQVVAHYDRIIRHPAVLDLSFKEIHFLVWKKGETFRSFGVQVAHNELDVLRAILDWYMVDRDGREQQAVCLLRRVDYERLTSDQLETLVNCLLLNGYSDEVKSFLRSQFHCESARRPPLQGNLFQDLPRSNLPDPCLSPDSAMATPRPTIEPTLSELRLSDLKSKLEQDIADDREEKAAELRELLVDSLKNLLHLGSFSLGNGHLSSIYSLNSQRSVMLLFGGFTSYLPSKEQGRQMYHLIRRAQPADQPGAIPSLLTHDWFPLQRRLPKNLAHFAAIRVLNCIFVLGGLDLSYLLLNNERKRVKPTSSCYVFSLTTSDWYMIKSMNSSRAFHGAIHCGQFIYVYGGVGLGGGNQLTVIGSMEYYDIGKNCWFSVTCEPSPGARMAFGMELVDEDKICIVGGIASIEDRNLNFSSTSLLDDVWCLNVHNKTFAEITKLRLPSPHASFGMIRHRDELLLIGGLQISGGDASNKANESNRANEPNSDRKANTTGTKNGQPVTTGDVLACRLLRHCTASEWPQFANCRPQNQHCKLQDPTADQYWYVHSKLNQQRIFPSVSRLSADDDTLLVAGGKTQDHPYLKRTSLANYCSTYEVLNCETMRWVESPMMFATFGSAVISLI